jgi:Pilus formation protein N terminal region
MTALCVRGMVGPRRLHWLAVAALLVAAGTTAAIAEPILVPLDQAKVIKVPERAATVVIGNPIIADLSIQPGGIAVITGKAYGATNVIVMDATGAVLLEKSIAVQGPSDPTVVVYRGIDRHTYSCTPMCEPRITLGDDPEYFNRVLAESASRNTQALAAAAGSSAPAPGSDRPTVIVTSPSAAPSGRLMTEPPRQQ